MGGTVAPHVFGPPDAAGPSASNVLLPAAAQPAPGNDLASNMGKGNAGYLAPVNRTPQAPAQQLPRPRSPLQVLGRGGDAGLHAFYGLPAAQTMGVGAQLMRNR